jgi:hypothetical protein
MPLPEDGQIAPAPAAGRDDMDAATVYHVTRIVHRLASRRTTL